MTEGLSYQGIRTANAARESDEQRKESRKKNLLILVLHYLTEEGYIESAKTLGRETNLDVTKFEVCDNISLETVLMDYEAYYHVKFQRYPKITKKLPAGAQAAEPVGRAGRPAALKSRSNSSNSLPKLLSQQKASQSLSSATSSSSSKPAGRSVQTSSGSKRRENDHYSNGDTGQMNGNDELALKGLVLQPLGNASADQPDHHQKAVHKGGRQIVDVRAMINDATRLNHTDDGNNEDRLLKPLGGYLGYNMEWRELAQVISRDIFSNNPNVRWDDIIGLDTAKRLVKEAVVYPIKYPQLFTGILSPWKGLLLYGPPGTGKTMLAKAVATECRTTFFNISASTIVSKWRGDSEKLVRVLFELARFHAPSTIFLDELESLMSQRGGQSGQGEHEGSRRMKTELLVQMDGLAKSDDLVFLLAASNLPWELDHAMLRRLEKRILVGLPTRDARCSMFCHYLPETICANTSNGFELKSDLDYGHLAEMTEGYSGSDIRLVCKEAAMRPVRKIFNALENHAEGEELDIVLDTITTRDVESALASTKPSARTLAEKYAAWQREYESA